MIINPKKKETKHNKTCVLESDLGKIRKKVEIKRRSTIAKKAVYTDVNVARDLYEGALSVWELLDKNYPRTYKRKAATSSTKGIFSYIDSYENLMQSHFE